MAQTVNTNIGPMLMTFNFTDFDGEVFSSFRFNPGDLTAVDRFAGAIKFFEKNRDRKFANHSEFVAFNAKLEDKICDAIGCEKSAVFGKIPAATILPDGEFFVAKVLRTISGAIAEETARRRAARMELVNKYAGKYDADPTAGLAPGQEV